MWFLFLGVWCISLILCLFGGGLLVVALGCALQEFRRVGCLRLGGRV